ncbi:MAG: GNAT family N-acetyltransferase [Pseudomonadota bacterium]
MKLELIPVKDNFNRTREIWENLEAGANTSYFLSWGWIENWIASLPEHVNPELAVIREGENPILAFFLGKMNLVRKRFFKSRGWFVNSTGIPALDRTYIEYNGFLCKRNQPIRFIDILKHLPESWDEFYLPGLDTRIFPGTAVLENIHPYKAIINDNSLSPFVDLEMVRAKGGDYLSFLSANTRAQINRSYRLIENIAPVKFEIAQDVLKAVDIYYELVALHESTWTNKSKEGAFSSDYLFQFHKQLIQNRFQYNEIQLLRIKCDGNTIGCLYNFVYKNNVYFYQSGINYHLDKRLKPGYLTHVEAIRFNTVAGHKTYDFLGGNNRYKMSLATHHNQLIWVKVQKPLLKFRIENALRKLKFYLEGQDKKPGAFDNSEQPAIILRR